MIRPARDVVRPAAQIVGPGGAGPDVAAWQAGPVRSTSVLLSRLLALVVLVLAVLNGSAFETAGAGLRTAIVLSLVMVTAAAMVLPTSAGDSGLIASERWVVTAAATLCVAGSALTVLSPDGTGAAVPMVTIALMPRAINRRSLEVALIVVAVAGEWLFAWRIGASWWAYPALLAGLIGCYQTGLRGRDRKERLENAELMLAREQALAAERERAAASAERERIARDLHDVLAHTLSGLAITLQGASLLIGSGRAAEAGVQVDRARALAVEGLSEARAAVAALAPATRTDAVVDLAAALDRMVRDHRAVTGTRATLELGRLPELSAPVVTATLGVVREALTNTVRHAAGRPVRVSAGVQSGTLLVQVHDELGEPSAPAADGGMGVRGMTARMAEVGGSVTAGPDPTGWSVRVTVPARP